MFSQLLMNWRIFYIDHIIKLRFELQFFYVLFPGIGRVKKFLSLTCLHSWIFIRINIFNFKKQTNKQKNKTNKNTKKSKEIEEKKRITLEYWFKKKPGEDISSHPFFWKQEHFFWPHVWIFFLLSYFINVLDWVIVKTSKSFFTEYIFEGPLYRDHY